MDGLWPTFKRRRQAPAPGSAEAPSVPAARTLQPAQVVLPLQDRAQDPYELCVRSGDRVSAGQIVGRAGRPPRHMAVHASIAGVVQEPAVALHPLQERVMCVVIAADAGGSRITHGTRLAGFSGMPGFLRDMGIPPDACSPSLGKELLINATEFEPGFSSVEQLFADCQDRIREGLAVLMDISGAKRARIVAEKRRPALCEHIRNVCAGVAGARIERISQPWPATVRPIAALQAQTARSACGPVADPATLVALADACLRGIAWTDQLITVCGSGVARPVNLWIPCGTSLKDSILHAGGRLETIGRVTLGGPMMGIAQHTVDVPLIKQVRGIHAAPAVVFDELQSSRFYRRGDCIRCGKCVDACPAGILPNRVAEFVEHSRMDEAREHGLFACLECGLCYYVCPARIPLSAIMALGKVRLQGPGGLLTFRQYQLPIEPSAGDTQ